MACPNAPGYAAAVPLASVYPLVRTRSLARPFTYEVPEGRAGRGRRRSLRPGGAAGVVVEVGVEAPAG